MISEFQQLAQKVDQLVALVNILRDENTDSRRQIAKLSETNEELTERIQAAHERMSVVLNNAPFTEQESE